jgi:RNA polymerase sigma-70 factor (ECF subfamily)
MSAPTDLATAPDPTASTAADVSMAELDSHRRELTGYCYRMLGSGFDAEDAVQETLVRAWRKAEGFEGRSSLRSWLYRIATNVCLDMLRSRNRRAWPVDLGPASTADLTLGAQSPERTWVMPMPDSSLVDLAADPGEVAATKDSIRLAFITALQKLPPRQRAVLILREVLKWQASEVAELLDSSVASVNSALQRARATLGSTEAVEDTHHELDAEQRALLDRYVKAFEAYDIEQLVAVLHEDAILSMPPWPHWIAGRDEVLRWFFGQGIGCRGSRLVATQANGQAAFASYKPDAEGGWSAWSIQVIDTDGERVTGQHNFLDTRLFRLFGLPERLS